MCSVKKFFVADVNLIGEEDIAAIRYTLSFKKLLKTFTGLIWVLSIAKITIDIIFSIVTCLPVHIADDPLSCVAVGTGKALDQEQTFSTMLTEY